MVLSASAVMALGQEKAVDLELALGVDVSASVSEAEFDLQRHGLAEAFRDPAVQAAVEAGDGIAVALFYWAGDQEQSMAVEWSLVSDAASSAEFADEIETTERRFDAPHNCEYVPVLAAKRHVNVGELWARR